MIEIETILSLVAGNLALTLLVWRLARQDAIIDRMLDEVAGERDNPDDGNST